MLVPGVEDDGVGGIEIAIGLGPFDGCADMRCDFIRRGGGGVNEWFFLIDRCGIGCGFNP